MTRTSPHAGRRFIATLAAAALALAGITATAAPARAQGDEFARILFGAAVLAIIGSAIANANQPRPVPPAPVWNPRPPVHPPVVHPPVVKPWLPAHCEMRVGGRAYFGEVCLTRAGFTHRLPQSCARQVQTNRGWRIAYDAQCLRQAGWRN
jgi:hypothetical protein